MIRRATLTDVPQLLMMARAEHAVSRLKHIPFNEKKTLASLAGLIDGMTSVVFISEKGFIIGIIQPMLFNLFWNAYELAWFSEDGQGMGLLRELEKWAVNMRALDLVIHNYAGLVSDEKFTKVMGRSGFVSLGNSYTKQLGEI